MNCVFYYIFRIHLGVVFLSLKSQTSVRSPGSAAEGRERSGVRVGQGASPPKGMEIHIYTIILVYRSV